MVMKVAATVAAPGLQSGPGGTAAGTTPDIPARLRATVLAARPDGLLIDLKGQVLALGGAPPLPPGTTLTLLVPAGARLGEPGTMARLRYGDGQGVTDLPVRIRPGEAPAVLAPRPAPALPALLSVPGRPAATAQLWLQVSPVFSPAVAPASDALARLADPGRAAATMAALTAGAALPALVLPQPPGGAVRLGLPGLIVELATSAVDLPEQSSVEIRLAQPHAGEALLRALLAGEGTERSPEAERWSAGERLAARLRLAVGSLDEPTPGPAGEARSASAATGGERAGIVPAPFLHESEPQAPLRLAWERNAQGRDDGETPHMLVIEIAFERLGRIRLEIARDGRGDLHLVLRAEQPLPDGARAAIRDLAGAAFELAGRPAHFLAITGPFGPAASRVTTGQ